MSDAALCQELLQSWYQPSQLISLLASNFLHFSICSCVGDCSFGCFVLVPRLRQPDDVAHVDGNDPVVTEVLVHNLSHESCFIPKYSRLKVQEHIQHGCLGGQGGAPFTWLRKVRLQGVQVLRPQPGYKLVIQRKMKDNGYQEGTHLGD